MSLIELTSILTVILFGTISIFLSRKERIAKKELTDRERNQKQRIYEIAILKEIQERIGYELNVEKVIDVITGSLRNLFPYSTSSSLFVKEDKLVFKTYVEESVSHEFIEQVKKNSISSLSAIFEKQLPLDIDESISGVVLDDTNNAPLTSFFNIPLVVNNTVVGIINVSSIKPGLYKEDEMTILYRITTQASNALSHLQEVLTTEKGKLMSLIGSLADGVFMLDVNNQVLVINDAAKSILKIQKEEVGILDVLSSLPKTYDISDRIKEATTNNKTIEEKEIQIEDKTVQVFITPVLDTNTNKAIGVSVLLHDITLEKNLARVKEDFTNMMVHELRSPLTAIKDASTFIITSGQEKQDNEKMLNIIHDQSKLLLEYVSSLLDAAKIEAGRFIIQKKPGSIKEAVEKSADVFRSVAKTKNVNLEVSIQESLPSVSFDSIRIGQVLNNLLSNSLKFTPEGGKITVRASVGAGSSRPNVSEVSEGNSEHPNIQNTQKTQSTGISVPIESGSELSENQSRLNRDQNVRKSDLADTLNIRSSEYSEFSGNTPLLTGPQIITVSVSDTGVGIPKDKQGELFSKFAQVLHPAAQTSSGGTGLGLYIAKGIVESHGGTISLDSDIGQGTTISFTLPVDISVPDVQQQKVDAGSSNLAVGAGSSSPATSPIEPNPSSYGPN